MMPAAVDPINCAVDDAFAAILAESGGSLLLSAYQANRVVTVACIDGRVTLPMMGFDRPMGLAFCGTTLAIGLRDQIVLFERTPPGAAMQLPEHVKCDALFLPRITYHTGEIATHDLAVNASGELWFLNTHFSCLCRINPRLSFEPVWQPPFITQIAPDDRCHLNGLTLVDEKPKYATCLGETDTYTGWRANKLTGGCLIDIQSNEVVARGLSMPHSPRWHDNRLWMLNSATGELVTVDAATGRQTMVATLPGYLRGLEFIGSTALVGMSVIRSSHMLGSLPVQHKFPQMLCGVAAVDLRSGAVLGMLKFTRGCAEIFEVKFLPDIRQPILASR